ncbi:MAG: VanW family protein [Oscillospiraceae bacterium]|nr:VanW family protein [Oscillospiraceae bacterium]
MNAERYDSRDDREEERPRKRTAARPAPTKRKKRKKKKESYAGLAVIVTLLFLLVLGGIGVYVAGTMVSRIDTIYPGTAVEGIDLSGMTKEQAAEALLSLGRAKYDGLSVTASLPLDNTLTITAEEAGVSYSAEQIVEDAWNYGRGDGMLMNLLTYGKARYMDTNTFSSDKGLEVWLDEDAVRAIVAEAAVDIDEQLLESGVEITDTEIRLSKGASGLTLDEETVVRQFKEALLAADPSGFTYDAVPQADEAYDFQGLYDELYSEMVNARIVYAPEYAARYADLEPAPEDPPIINYAWGNEELDRKTEPAIYRPALTDPQPGDESLDFGGKPFIVSQSSVGVTFDVAEAERLWAAAGYGDSVVVPLTVTRPDVSTDEINAMLFADPLSKNWTMVRLWNKDYCDEVRTSLAGSTKNRISNVKKACEILDGIMLMPGEEFSYNDTIGQRTEEAGWLPAPAYANGEVRQENGGGICQVSSTLYNAVAYSNLRVLERECHQFQVGYLPAGMDATVSWGWPNFRFMNTKQYPIMIHAWVDDETNECCIQILGTDYEHIFVIMRFNQWKTYDQSGEYVDEDGNGKAIGTEAATWRLLYHDGDDWSDRSIKPFSECYEYYSKYHYHSEDI